MSTKILRWAILGAAGMAVTACGGNTPIAASVPVSKPASFESQFGTGFGTAFSASNTSDPAVPASGDIIPLSLTSEPVALH